MWYYGPFVKNFNFVKNSLTYFYSLFISSSGLSSSKRASSLRLRNTCVVLKTEKMQSACFFSTHSLASIKQKKQNEHCMKEIQTHGTCFCAWYYDFCFCSHVLPGEKNWIVLPAKHQRDGFYPYLCGLTFYLQLAYGPPRL